MPRMISNSESRLSAHTSLTRRSSPVEVFPVNPSATWRHGQGLKRDFQVTLPGLPPWSVSKKCDRRPVAMTPVQVQEHESLLLGRNALCTEPLTMGCKTGLSQTQLWKFRRKLCHSRQVSYTWSSLACRRIDSHDSRVHGLWSEDPGNCPAEGEIGTLNTACGGLRVFATNHSASILGCAAQYCDSPDKPARQHASVAYAAKFGTIMAISAGAFSLRGRRGSGARTLRLLGRRCRGAGGLGARCASAACSP